MKPTVVFLGLVLLAIIGAFVTRPLFDKASTNVPLASTQDVLNAANQGGAARQQREFPNTPQGRMTRLMYEFIQESDRQQIRLEEGMKEIGWDWVMTPESLRTKENIAECLSRLEKAKRLNQDYAGNLRKAWSAMLAKMELESRRDKQAEKYFEAVKKEANLPGGGLYFSEKISNALSGNHDALEQSLRFLEKRSGRYHVDDQGHITFDPTIPRSERDQYDILVKNIDDSMQKITELVKLRDQLAQKRMQKAEELLKTGSSRTP